MECRPCIECEVGQAYYLHGGACQDCSYVDSTEIIGIYVGLIGNQHRFRVNLTCARCKRHVDWYLVPCRQPDGIDVTDEFNQMFHRKDSHWIGGSNAKRQSE